MLSFIETISNIIRPGTWKDRSVDGKHNGGTFTARAVDFFESFDGGDFGEGFGGSEVALLVLEIVVTD